MPDAKPTVLIIDDDPDSLNLLRMRLEKAGHTFLQAVDGEEGLRTSGRGKHGGPLF
jgi:DNA-binding response OmpR family regulator